MKPWIQVCGDPTVDWFRIHNDDVVVRGGVYYWQKQDERSAVRLSSKPGGSALVMELLQTVLTSDKARVEGVAIDEELLNRPKDGRITTSWTSWREFPNPGLGQGSYRLADWHEFEPGEWDYSVALTGYPDLLVIWDSNLGFRSYQENWPEILTSPQPDQEPEHIIYKLGQYNDGQPNPLLDRIVQLGYNQSTTIITSLSDLRACAVKVGISLSWERMLEEVVQAVYSPNCPFIDKKGTLKYQQVIIPVGNSAAIIVNSNANILIFDRSGQEGDFAEEFPGQIIGDNTCIVVALAANWAENRAHTDWIQACYEGVELARYLQIHGYDVVDKGNHKHLEFPYRTIAAAYRNLQMSGVVQKDFIYNDKIHNLGIFVDESNIALKQSGSWTILENALLKNQPGGQLLPDYQSIMAVNECACDIVVRGPRAALLDVPIETIGGWYSADRQEIEGVRSVSNAMKDYLKQKNPQTPLCVAVFGPPGSGKSFAIKEIAKGLGIEADAQLTFNLSQFESPRELQTAFHQICDLNLRGKMPLVFWDEFDTPCEGHPLGWLRYFLSPMQDGEFSDQGLTHPLGSGIYVFAGATRYSYEEFRSGNLNEDRNAKKPDFISRLRAYINIRGINANPNTIEDRLYMVRRAFILRQYLEANVPQIQNQDHFEIEAGVLDGFLMVTNYRYGTRSLENLLKMSSLADKRKYELSSLPPDHIIEMHTNLKEFHDLVSRGHRKTVRIGVSGCKDLSPQLLLPIQESFIKAGDFIKQEFPEHNITLLSSLTTWADRNLIREVLATDAARFIAVLPWSRPEYFDYLISLEEQSNDSQDDLISEFDYWLTNRNVEIIEMPPSPTRQAAYNRVVDFITEHSDIQMFIWNKNDLVSGKMPASLAQAEKPDQPVCLIIIADEDEDSTVRIQYKNFPGQAVGAWDEI